MIRSGRPKGAKNGTYSNDTCVTSFRLKNTSLVDLDKIRDKLKDMCDIEVSRSFMLEMILAQEHDIEKFKKMIEDES